MSDIEEVNYGKKTIYKNSIMSVAYKFAGMALSLVSTPLMLACLGEKKYGIWASLLSLVSWIYYFDLGIGNGLRNNLATSIAKNDFETSKKYLSVSYVLLSFISAGFFIVLLIVFRFINLGDLLNVKIDGENINSLMLCALFLACINFVVSLVNNVLYALQKASAVSLFNIVGQALFILGMVIYLIIGMKSLLMVAVAEGVAQLLKNIIETIYVYGKNTQLRFKIKKVDYSYANGIMSFGLQIFVMQLAALVLNSTDNIIIVRFIGATDVTPYNMCYKYFNLINGVFVALITPLLSAYTAAYTKKDIRWIHKTLWKSLYLYFVFLVGLIVAGFIFKPFAKIWLRKELIYQNGLILLVGLYFAMLMFTHVFSSFLMGLSSIKETTIAMAAEAIVNIPISIVFVTKCGMGVNGVILGSIVSMAIAVVVFPLKGIRVMKKLEVDN